MKRRISPLSFHEALLRPGTASQALDQAGDGVGLAFDSAWPFVSERSGVGMRTSTGMGSLLRAGSAGGL